MEEMVRKNGAKYSSRGKKTTENITTKICIFFKLAAKSLHFYVYYKYLLLPSWIQSSKTIFSYASESFIGFCLFKTTL